MKTPDAIDVLLVLAWGGVTIYYIVMAVIEWRYNNKLNTSGIAVEGKVFSKQIQENRTGKNRKVYDYYVTYFYDYGGSQHERTQQIGKGHYDKIEKGQAVDVRCLPDDPKTALLAGKDADHSKFNRYAIIGVVCAVLFIVFAGATLPRR